jgi:hypothetical protein
LAALFLVYFGGYFFIHGDFEVEINAFSMGQRLELSNVPSEKDGKMSKFKIDLHLAHFKFFQVEYFVDEPVQLFPIAISHFQQPNLLCT